VAPANKETLRAKTPQGKRFSGLFNVAAISANRHGIGCYDIFKLTGGLLWSKSRVPFDRGRAEPDADLVTMNADHLSA
jgi:hypothetical protein